MKLTLKTIVAFFVVGLVVLSGCAQPPAQEQPAATEPEAPAVEPLEAPEPAQPAREAPAPVAPAPSGGITASDIVVSAGEPLLTHQPTKDIPVDPKGQEMAVGEYTGQTEQTTSNKNAGYWDCIKSKIGEFKNEAPDSTFDQQLVAANRACVDYHYK